MATLTYSICSSLTRLLTLVDDQHSNISGKVSTESCRCPAIQAGLKRILDWNRGHVTAYMWPETASSY